MAPQTSPRLPDPPSCGTFYAVQRANANDSSRVQGFSSLQPCALQRTSPHISAVWRAVFLSPHSQGTSLTSQSPNVGRPGIECSRRAAYDANYSSITALHVSQIDSFGSLAYF